MGSKKKTIRWCVSRFVLVNWESGGARLILAKSGQQWNIRDPRFFDFIRAFASPQRIEDALAAPDMEGLEQFVPFCQENGILVREGEEDRSALRYWELADLHLHTSSREAAGMTYRFEKVPGLSAPAQFSRIQGKIVPLPEPEPAGSRAFLDVLNARKSVREFEDGTLGLGTLSTLLFQSARHMDTWLSPHGEKLTRRPYPSGGARHSLDIYAIVRPRSVAKLAGGVYRYVTEKHAFEVMSPSSSACKDILASSSMFAEGNAWVLLAMVSRYPRVAWKYEGLAYSLVLKEVGCLMQTLYLTAENLGLGACAIGGGTRWNLAELLKKDPHSDVHVGEIVVGLPKVVRARAKANRPKTKRRAGVG